MSNATTNKPYIFLHLTKTAGGTLKNAISVNENINVEFVYGKDDRERLKKIDKGGLDLIYGHVLFGFHRELGIEPNYLCFVRHPISRTISHYYHLKSVEKGPAGDKVRRADTIDHFFEDHYYWEFDNFLTRIISGLGNKKEIDMGRAFLLAKRNINKYFRFIGSQEYFDLSLSALGNFLDARFEPEKNINVRAAKGERPSEDTIERIRSLNRTDIKLYNYVMAEVLKAI